MTDRVSVEEWAAGRPFTKIVCSRGHKERLLERIADGEGGASLYPEAGALRDYLIEQSATVRNPDGTHYTGSGWVRGSDDGEGRYDEPISRRDAEENGGTIWPADYIKPLPQGVGPTTAPSWPFDDSIAGERYTRTRVPLKATIKCKACDLSVEIHVDKLDKLAAGTTIRKVPPIELSDLARAI